jgi:hypothetical protein
MSEGWSPLERFTGLSRSIVDLESQCSIQTARSHTSSALHFCLPETLTFT